MNKPESTAGGALFDLAPADLELRHEEAYESDSHTARTLARERDLRIVLIVTPHRLTPFALVDGPRVIYSTDEGRALAERSVGCGG
jgi:hypothetical protein